MSERIEKRTVKRAVKAAAKPIVESIKSNLSLQDAIRSGATRESIGTVIRSYQRGLVTVAVMGPLSGRQQTYKGKEVDPAKIGHLIERGHEATGWFREMGGNRVAGKPFVRPAIDQHRESSQVIFVGVIRSEIAAIAGGA